MPDDVAAIVLLAATGLAVSVAADCRLPLVAAVTGLLLDEDENRFLLEAKWDCEDEEEGLRMDVDEETPDGGVDSRPVNDGFHRLTANW
jgi:hypothetical protein